MLELIIVVALVGVLVWAITTFIPMPPNFAKLIYVIAVVCMLFYVLQAFGVVTLTEPAVWARAFAVAPPWAFRASRKRPASPTDAYLRLSGLVAGWPSQ